MIYGIGIDIQDISKFEETLNRSNPHFIQRVFTKREREYAKELDINQTLAGKWAVKEAFLKAIGKGITNLRSLKNIEVDNLPNGKPHNNLYSDLRDKLSDLEYKIDVSISHSGNYAVGLVVISRKL